ncbi:MAG: hypothetical protein C5B52_06560 [Bacteroidetes bacterium]|nr:MAG: hypothetical protein C5B52_06560 [Bacteroidota bacterium]
MKEENNFLIRFAGPQDVKAIAALHVTTFMETHGAAGPTLETRQGQWTNLFQNFDGSWFCIVIEDNNGNLIGFARGQSYDHTDLPDYNGTLNKIYLLREYHKIGLGKKMLCAVVHEFINRGISSMVLFGDASNPSNKFYEAMGGEKLMSDTGEFHGGYGWKNFDAIVERCKQIHQ